MKNASNVLALVTLGLSSLGCAADVGPYDLDNPPAYDDDAAREDEAVDVELGESNAALTLSWSKVSGCATDVGVAGDGTAWITGCTYSGSGFGIYKWNGSSWEGQSGRAENIAVTPSGQVWVTNGLDEIYKRKSDGSWQKLPGWAEDIDADDYWTWIVASDDQNYSQGGVYLYNPNVNQWMPIEQPLFRDAFGAKFAMAWKRVAVGKNQAVYLAGQRDDVIRIYKYQGFTTNQDSGPWQLLTTQKASEIGDISDFSANRETDELWLTTKAGKTRIYRNGGWSDAGVEARTVSAASNVRAWAIRPGGSIYRTP